MNLEKYFNIDNKIYWLLKDIELHTKTHNLIIFTSKEKTLKIYIENPNNSFQYPNSDLIKIVNLLDNNLAGIIFRSWDSENLSEMRGYQWKYNEYAQLEVKELQEIYAETSFETEYLDKNIKFCY